MLREMHGRYLRNFRRQLAGSTDVPLEREFNIYYRARRIFATDENAFNHRVDQ